MKERTILVFASLLMILTLMLTSVVLLLIWPVYFIGAVLLEDEIFYAVSGKILNICKRQ